MLILLQIILIALKTSGILTCSWAIIFIPLYLILVRVVLEFILDSDD